MSEPHPAYYAAQTLIGGEPDCNERFIYRSSDRQIAWRRMPGEDGWSEADQAALDFELSRLLNSVALIPRH